jgi:hypothetical protein
MNVEPSTLLTVAGAAAAVIASYATLGYRVRQLERQATENKTERTELRKLVDEVNFSRTDQGKRIGAVESDTAILKGKFDGFDRGYGAGRRSRTSAEGNPMQGGAAK